MLQKIITWCKAAFIPKECACVHACACVCTHSSVVEVGRDTLIFIDHLHSSGSFPGSSYSKESACNAGDLDLIPGLGRFPWRREWQPTAVFLPGEFCGPRSLAGYSPWGCKKSDVTE